MSEFRVTPQTLQQKAQELSAKNSRLRQLIEQLQQQKNELNGQWEGDAKTTFDSAFNADVPKLMNFTAAIDEYVQKLAQIAQEYDNAERKNVSVIG